MIRPINHDLTFLSHPSIPATPADRSTVTDLIDTLTSHQDECVGMAANMIGVSKRIIVVQMGLMVVPMINPEVISQSGPRQQTEGCLSISGQKKATRYQTITVKYQDLNFHPQQQVFQDWIAQIIQHEVDHCNGVLI